MKSKISPLTKLKKEKRKKKRKKVMLRKHCTRENLYEEIKANEGKLNT